MSYTITHEITFAYGLNYNGSRRFHVAKGPDARLDSPVYMVDGNTGEVIGFNIGSSDASLKEWCVSGPVRSAYVPGITRRWFVKDWVQPEVGEVWNGPIINKEQYIKSQPAEVQPTLRELESKVLLKSA
jgi:hypothetical protein